MKRKPVIFFCQKGSSVLEVVIMSGVMVAMLTGFMSLMSHESKNVAYLEDKLSRVALESELRMQFSNSEDCKNFLEGIVAPLEGKTANHLKIDPKVLSEVFQTQGNKKVYDKLEIKNISLARSNLTAPDSSGSVDLIFYPERMRKGGGPSTMQPITLKTLVSVDDNYKIKSCGAEDSSGGSCKVSDLKKVPVPKTARKPASFSIATGGSRSQSDNPVTTTMIPHKGSGPYPFLSSSWTVSAQNKTVANQGTMAVITALYGGSFFGRTRAATSVVVEAQCDNGKWCIKDGSCY